VTRAWIVLVMLLAARVANAEPESRPMAAPPPDGTGVPSRPAPADNRRIIAVLEVRVEGLPDDVKEGFQRNLEDQIDTKHYWLAGRASMKQWMMRSTKWVEGCVVGACLSELKAQTGAELALDAVFTGSRTSFGYILTVIRTDTGRVVQQNSNRCDVCTLSEVMNKVKLAAVELLNDVPDKLPDEAAEQRAATDAAVGKVKRELAAHDRHATRVGIVLTAAGVAAAIVGTVLYQSQNKPTYAVATAVGGGALAAGGVVVLTF
jgi:hypothetical protein